MTDAPACSMVHLAKSQPLQHGIKVNSNNDKCFIKLARSLADGAAFARELIQNAFDASPEPPEITYSPVGVGELPNVFPPLNVEKNKTIFRFTISNKGEMQPDELDALTRIGYSTKGDKPKLRGEFGNGFVLCLSPRIGSLGVQVTFFLGGWNWELNIFYDPPGQYNQQPKKTLRRHSKPSDDEPRTVVTVFHLLGYELVQHFLAWIGRVTSRPFFLNKKSVGRPLRDIQLNPYSLHAFGENDQQNEFHIQSGIPFFYFSGRDSISINIMDLPVMDRASAYRTLTGNLSGDHMPQNETGQLFLHHNEIILNSHKLSLNTSRNAVVNDDEFKLMRAELDLLVKWPLLQKVQQSLRSNLKEGYAPFESFSDHLFGLRFGRHQEAANLYTMRFVVQKMLKKESVGPYAPVIDGILDWKLFASTRSANADDNYIWSLRQVLDECPQYILYDDELGDDSLETMIQELLHKSQPIFINETMIFGGWEIYSFSDIVKPALKDVRPVIALSEIVRDWDLYRKLVAEGFLREAEPLEMSLDEKITEKYREALVCLASWFNLILHGLPYQIGSKPLVIPKVCFTVGRYNAGISQGVYRTLVRSFSDNPSQLEVRLDQDNSLFKQVMASNVPRHHLFYLLHLVLFELCHMVSEYMRFLHLLPLTLPQSTPQYLEDYLMEGYLQLLAKNAPGKKIRREPGDVSTLIREIELFFQ